MTDDKNRIIVPLKVARPFCPQCMEICSHHRDYECFRRWSRPIPRDIGRKGCPGFVRDAVRTRAVLLAERISGQKAMTVSEAMRELSMAHRLEDIEEASS